MPEANCHDSLRAVTEHGTNLEEIVMSPTERPVGDPRQTVEPIPLTSEEARQVSGGKSAPYNQPGHQGYGGGDPT